MFHVEHLKDISLSKANKLEIGKMRQLSQVPFPTPAPALASAPN